jgi:hypothetical protein
MELYNCDTADGDRDRASEWRNGCASQPGVECDLQQSNESRDDYGYHIPFEGRRNGCGWNCCI